MIPKKIHYCWFGKGQMPESALKCIESWKQYLPEYEIKEWNETNFDVDLFLYTKQAYQNKKFAFVTDVVRLYALKKEGGIYLDSDVEVLKPLDIFLHHKAFSGFESDSSLPTGIMGSEKDGKWVTDLLEYYYDKPFLNDDNSPNLTTNVVIISDKMKRCGFSLNNTFQEQEDYVAFYPSDYFCPKHPATKKLIITKNSHCIHHFAGSWAPKKTLGLKIKVSFSKTISLFIGKNNFNKLYKEYKEFYKKN